ncbi:MAG: MFS transporter [Clostridia bacterium]|nr:MFS transporter [Clostridia bacterium]
MEKFRSIFRPESAYRAFFLSILLMGLGYGLYKGVIDNYLAEIVSMTEFDRGVAEFFRELPGLALVFLLAAMYTLSAETIYKIGAVIMLCGMTMLFAVPSSRIWVTLAICVHSLGEHIQLGMKNTLSLEYAREGRGGAALGMQNALNQAGTLAGYIVVMFAFLFLSGAGAFRAFFLVSAVVLALGTASSMRLTGSSATDKSRSRFYFRRKYTKYYFLEVFYGARKQVFFTFGPYVLILFYGASTATISLLFAVTAVCGFFAAPLVGRIIDRVGYKAVMVTDTLILVIVCFFYGFAHHLFPMRVAYVICCVNYVLDSIISLASMASNVYVQAISDSTEEVRATISTGISVNHLITILIALFGGWIWRALGIETLFTLSAVLGLCNSAYAASIRVPGKQEKSFPGVPG